MCNRRAILCCFCFASWPQTYMSSLSINYQLYCTNLLHIWWTHEVNRADCASHELGWRLYRWLNRVWPGITSSPLRYSRALFCLLSLITIRDCAPARDREPTRVDADTTPTGPAFARLMLERRDQRIARATQNDQPLLQEICPQSARSAVDQ